MNISELISSKEDGLIIEKSVNTENAIIGDVLVFGIRVINTGSSVISGITVIDNLESNLKFINGSVLVDGKCSTLNILKGVNLGCLKPNDSRIIYFKAEIVSMPSSCYINNFALVKYCLDTTGTNKFKVLDKKSNTVTVKVDVAELEVIKMADKEKASVGEAVNYQVIIKNIGTVQALGVLFIDQLPKEMYLIANSFSVNGCGINYCDNDIRLYVGDIDPGECIRINYTIIVEASNCKRILLNSAYAYFSYNLENSSFGEKKSICSNKSSTRLGIDLSTFKQITINENLSISPFKPAIHEINELDVELIIDDYYEVKTPKGISSDGQILTGNKLIIKGSIQVVLQYIAEDEDEKICIEIYKIPFSTFIILPENYEVGSNITIETIIEDVEYKIIDCFSIYTNITFVINGNIHFC